MESRNNMIRRYEALNRSAVRGSTVIFGSDEELQLPVFEMTERYAIKESIVNRSFSRLSLSEAQDLYERCAAPLMASKVIIRAGSEDRELFDTDRAAFDRAFIGLIAAVRSDNAACSIVLVSDGRADMSEHIRGIASSCGCGFCDAEAARACDMSAVMDVMTMGFVRPVKKSVSASLLAKALYSFENSACEAEAAEVRTPSKHWYTGLFRLAGSKA